MTIFNRWGEQVFQRTRFLPSDPTNIDIKNSWDGTYNGKLLNPDVYIYVITVTCNSGTTSTFTGSVTLIR